MLGLKLNDISETGPSFHGWRTILTLMDTRRIFQGRLISQQSITMIASQTKGPYPLTKITINRILEHCSISKNEQNRWEYLLRFFLYLLAWLLLGWWRFLAALVFIIGSWFVYLYRVDLVLLPRVRGFWSWFGGVCSLTYCNGNFRVTMVSEPFNVIL